MKYDLDSILLGDYCAVFAARTEIKVWQDYHVRKLLTHISITGSCKKFTLVAILRTRLGHNKCQFTAKRYIQLRPLRLMPAFADLIGCIRYETLEKGK